MKLTELLTALLLAAALPAAAQMNYQGRLTDASGNPLADGQQTLEFSLWDLATGGTAALNQVWGPYTLDGSAGRPKADLVSGRFNVVLGPLDATNRPLTGAFNGPRFIQIKVGTNSPITPRQQILAAPDAIHAQIASTVPDGAIGTAQLGLLAVTGANIADGTITASKLSGAGSSLWDGNGTSVWRPAGNVGIGTATPAFKLEVNGGGNGTAAQITSPEDNVSLHLKNTGIGGMDWSIQSTGGTSGSGQGKLCFITGSGSGTGSPVVTVQSNGNFGIGTTTPNARLHIGGSYPFFGRPPLAVQTNVSKATAATTGVFSLGSSDTTHPFGMTVRLISAPANANRAVIFQTGEIDLNDAGNLAFQYQGGFVGIGTSAPRAKLEVSGTKNLSYNIGGFLNRNGASDLTNTNITRDVSILTSGIIVGTEVHANSDARIKNIQGRSDSTADLATLGRIEITDYKLKDVIANGSRANKKVIAQQVEQVYPQAVSRQAGVIPDIYKSAPVRDGWITLATDLKCGEHVQLIADKEQVIHEVLEVRDGAFRTALKPGTETVFVFGREVNDFRSVDYDAIAMLNVSATQELARQLAARDACVAAKDARIAALEKSLAALQAKDEARDTQLAAIEALLSSDAGKTATVSMTR